MREIKFRVWDVNLQMMCYMNDDYELIFFPCGWSFEDKDGVTSTKIGNCTIMQYTDLHDKNGKEIYEGDIVKYGDDEPQEINQVRWGKFEDCCVEGETWILGVDAFQDGAIWQPTIWHYWDAEAEDNTLEVIGNIYENPELLK